MLVAIVHNGLATNSVRSSVTLTRKICVCRSATKCYLPRNRRTSSREFSDQHISMLVGWVLQRAVCPSKNPSTTTRSHGLASQRKAHFEVSRTPFSTSTRMSYQKFRKIKNTFRFEFYKKKPQSGISTVRDMTHVSSPVSSNVRRHCVVRYMTLPGCASVSLGKCNKRFIRNNVRVILPHRKP